MSSLPPSGSDPNIPPPPEQPGVPTAQPDRGARLALAGFLCGLTSLFATMLGIFPPLFFAYNAVPGHIGGERGLLILAACPVALAGLILSVQGRHSMSRRRLAIAELVLSVLALVFVLLFTVVRAAFYLQCSTHSCF